MAKKRNAQRTQKPLYKKWWLGVIVLCLIGVVGSGLSGCGKQDEPSASQAETQTPTSDQGTVESSELGPAETTPEAGTTPNETEPELDAREALDDVLGSTTFYENVRNDVTGKWRALVFYSSENIVDHAVEYYNAYFSSDDEVHMAVNLGLKTTGVMTVANGLMTLDVHEYLDGEEHDAKLLGSGNLLKEYLIDLSTGTVDDLSVVQTEDGQSINLDNLATVISAALPDVYQDSQWLDVSCDCDDNNGVYVMMQVDQKSDDSDASLPLAADCFSIAQNAINSNGAALVSFSITIVNDGYPVGIYSTENGKDFIVINDGKRTEVSLP